MKTVSQIGSMGLCFVSIWTAAAAAASPDDLLAKVTAVGREGTGSVEARQALKELAKSDAKVLPDVLKAFNGAGPLAANYLRSAFESIADRHIRGGEKLPAAEIERYIVDRKNDPRARRMAFEWLVKIDRTLSGRLTPGMLNDPSPELRRDAVQQLIDEADQLRDDKQAEKAILVYRKALGGAVDDDQVQAVVKPLRALGEKVDLQKHFGFLSSWHMIGPFDNRDRKGFAAAYPPEKGFQPQAEYKGQLGPVRWQPLSTDDEYGIIDVGTQLKNYKGSVMYAATEFTSAERQQIELRIGTPNAWKLWVNGRLLFGRDEYHRGMMLDQYRVRAELKRGRNLIVLKICQNEQTEDWAQRYQFQVRVCDGTGSAILPDAALSTTRLDAGAGTAAERRE